MDVTKRNNYNKQNIARQIALDAMAYRDLLNTTSLANDSSAVAEFNKIASKASLENTIKRHQSTIRRYKDCKTDIINFAKDNGATINEIKKLERELGARTVIFSEPFNLQCISDKYFYRKFFENYNLFSNSAFAANFDKTAKFLR